jgi:hypothetical protein
MQLTIRQVGVSKVDQLADFDWVREGPSPNWRLLSGDEENAISEVLCAALSERSSVAALDQANRVLSSVLSG